MSKSSDHTLSLHRLTSNSSSTTDLPTTELASESRVILRLAIYRHWVRLGGSSLETHDQHFFEQDTCFHSLYVISSVRIWEWELSLVVELTSSQSQGYVTTYGQSASLSWNKTPIWGLRPDFCYCQLWVYWWWGALSDERTGLSFTIAAGPR
jgi:hypothetical protein